MGSASRCAIHIQGRPSTPVWLVSKSTVSFEFSLSFYRRPNLLLQWSGITSGVLFNTLVNTLLSMVRRPC
jgi:hypothetical protein